MHFFLLFSCTAQVALEFFFLFLVLLKTFGTANQEANETKYSSCIDNREKFSPIVCVNSTQKQRWWWKMQQNTENKCLKAGEKRIISRRLICQNCACSERDGKLRFADNDRFQNYFHAHSLYTCQRLAFHDIQQAKSISICGFNLKENLQPSNAKFMSNRWIVA